MKYILFFFFLFSIAWAKTPVEQSLREHIIFHRHHPNKIGYISIGGPQRKPVDESTWIYVRKALNHYIEQKPIFILLDINASSGEYLAIEKIATLLKSFDNQTHIPIVCAINDGALSGAAMIPFACRYIAITKNSLWGASPASTMARPSLIHPSIREEFSDKADYFDRSTLIAQAMIDPEVLLVFRSNMVFKLRYENEIQKNDIVIVPKGLALTLNAQDMVKFSLIDIFLEEKKLLPITQEEKEKGIWPFSKELLSTFPFFSEIKQAEINAFILDKKTEFFISLSHPLISSLLLLIAIITLYIALSKMQLGLPALTGLIALAGILIGSYTAQLFSWVEVILLFAGFLLIFIEIFVTPTLGIAAIIGVFLSFIGIILLLLPDIADVRYDFATNTFNANGQFILERLQSILLSLCAAFAIIAILRYVYGFRLFSPFAYHGIMPHLGDVGYVKKPLTPQGEVVIGKKTYLAEAQDVNIEKGVSVSVVSIQGDRIIVKKQ